MKKKSQQIIVYQASGGAIELRGDIAKETVWATQPQIAGVFNVERSVITKHIRNILKDKELDRKQVCAKFAHTADGGAFAFIWFLRQAGILNIARLTPEALTALTLLIAESDPRNKDKMTGLVAMLLRK